MRFSLRWLFGTVAFVATGCLSLVYTSELLSNALGVAIFLFLAFAVLGAIYGREDTRPFWIGCAIFGWSYIADSAMPARAPGAWQAVDETLMDMDTELDSIVPDRKVSQGDFKFAGHSLTAFGLSIAGGAAAGLLSRRNTTKPREE